MASRRQSIRHEALFPVDIERLWEVVSDHRGMNTWFVPGMHIRLDPEGSPEANGKGAVRIFERAGYQVVEEVVDFEPPHRFTYTVLKGFPIRDHLGELCLERAGDQTRLVWTIGFEAKVPGTGWLVKGMITRLLRKGFRRLARKLAS